MVPLLIGGCFDNVRVRGKIHDLEQELAPFRNLAVQELGSANAESMRKLVALMSGLRTDYTNALHTINVLRGEIEQLKTDMPVRRRISAETAHRLWANLRQTKIKSVEVHRQGEDIDTQELTQSIAKIFADASIKTVLIAGIGQFAHGVRVVTKNPNDTALQEALRPLFIAIGESPNYQEGEALDGSTIQVYVGAAFPKGKP